jgi:hypothetical protein
MLKQYWMTRSTLIVQGGIDYSNKERNAVQGGNQISAFALKKLERQGYLNLSCNYNQLIF